MKTLSQLIGIIRGYIGETTEGYWSNSEIINNINRAKDDLWEAIETVNKQFFLKSYLIQGDGNNNYMLPDDFSSLESIRSVNNDISFLPTDMGYQKFQDVFDLTIGNSYFMTLYYDIVSRITNDGKSKWFIVFSPKLPIGKSVIIDYVSRPPDLVNANDNLGILDKYYGYILDKATYYTLLKGPSGEYDKWLQNSEIKLNRILSSIRLNNYKTEFVEGYLED